MAASIQEIQEAYEELKTTILNSKIIEHDDDAIKFLGTAYPFVTDSPPGGVELAQSGAGFMEEDWFEETAQLYKAAEKTTQHLNDLRRTTINIIAGVNGSLTEEEYYNAVVPARIGDFITALGNILTDEYFLKTDAGAGHDDGEHGDLNDLIATDTWMVEYSPPDTLETNDGEKYLLQVFNDLLEAATSLDELVVLPPVFLSRQLRSSAETEDFGGAVILSDRALELSLGDKINTNYSYYIGFRLNEEASSDEDGDSIRSSPYVPVRHSPYYNLDGPLDSGWDAETFSYLDNSEETKNLKEGSVPDANGVELDLGTPVIVTEIVEGASGVWVGFIPITGRLASYYGAVVDLEEELTDGYKKVLYTRPQYLRKLEALSYAPDPLIKYKASRPQIAEIFGQIEHPPVKLKDGTKLISESGNFNWTSLEPMDVRLSYFNFNKYNEKQAELTGEDLIINKETIDDNPILAFSEGYYYFIVGEGTRPTTDEIVEEEEDIPDETPYDDSMILQEDVDEELEKEKAKKSKQVSNQIKYDTFNQLLRYFGKDETETELLVKIRQKYFAPVSSRVNTRSVSPNNQQVLYTIPASYIDSLPASKKIYNNIFPHNSQFLNGNNFAFTIELGLLQERTDQIVAIFESMKEKIKTFESDGGVIKNPYDLPFDIDTQIKSIKEFPKIVEDFLSRQGWPRSTDYDAISTLVSNGHLAAEGTRHLLQFGIKDNGQLGENARETISHVLFSPDPKILEQVYTSPQSNLELFEFEPYITDEEMSRPKNAKRSAVVLNNGVAYLRRRLAGNIASDSAGSIAIGNAPESSLYGTRTLHYMMFSEALIKYKKSVDTKPDFETKDWIKVLQSFSVPPFKIYLSKDRALAPEEISCEEIIERLNTVGTEIGVEELKLQEMLLSNPVCMEKYYSEWSQPTPAMDAESTPTGLQEKLGKLEEAESNPKHMARFKIFYNAVLNSLDPQGLMALLMMCLQKQLGVEVTAKALCEIAIIKMIEADPEGFKEILINASPELAMALGFASASEAYLGNEANAIVEKYNETGEKKSSLGGAVGGVNVDESFTGAPIATAMKLAGEGSQLVSVIKSLERSGTYIDLVPADRPEEYGEIIIPAGLPGNVAPYSGEVDFGFGEGKYSFSGTVPQKYTWEEINAERKKLQDMGYSYSEVDGLLVQNGFLEVKYAQYESLLSGGTFLEPVGEIAYNINRMLGTGVSGNEDAIAGAVEFAVDGAAVLEYIKKYVDIVTVCEAVLGPILEFPDALFSLNFEQFGDDWLARLKKHFVLQLPTLSLPWGMPTDDMIGSYGEKLLSAFLVMIGTMIGQILQLLIRDAIEKCFLEDIQTVDGVSPEEVLESEQLPKLKNALAPVSAVPSELDPAAWFDGLFDGLNPQELCSLLRGTATNSLLRSLVLKTRYKYPEIYNHGFDSGEAIQSIFKKVGESFNLDICSAVESAPQEILIDTCDISYDYETRQEELMEKGLTEEEANTQMLLEVEDLKDKLGALSDFIFPDSNPLKLPNLCGKGGIFQAPPGVLDTMDRVTSNILSVAKGSLMQDLRAFKFFTMPNRALRAISNPEDLMNMHETYINTVKSPTKVTCFAYIGPGTVKEDNNLGNWDNSLAYGSMPNYALAYNEHVHYHMIMTTGMSPQAQRYSLPTRAQVKALQVNLDMDEEDVLEILDGDPDDYDHAAAWAVEIIDDEDPNAQFDNAGYKNAFEEYMGHNGPSGIQKTSRNHDKILNDTQFKFLTYLGVLRTEFDMYVSGEHRGVTGLTHYELNHPGIPAAVAQAQPGAWFETGPGDIAVTLYGGEGVVIWHNARFNLHPGIDNLYDKSSKSLELFSQKASDFGLPPQPGGMYIWNVISNFVKNYLYDRNVDNEIIEVGSAGNIARRWDFKIRDIWNDLNEYFWEQWDQEMRPIELERLFYSSGMAGIGVAEDSLYGPVVYCTAPNHKNKNTAGVSENRGLTPYGLPIGPIGWHDVRSKGLFNSGRHWLNKVYPLHTRLKDISDNTDTWVHMFDYYVGIDLGGDYEWTDNSKQLNAYIWSPGYRKLANSPSAEDGTDLLEVFMDLTLGEATGVTSERVNLLYPNINFGIIKGIVLTMAPFQAKLIKPNANGYYFNSSHIAPKVGNVLRHNTYLQWMERYHSLGAPPAHTGGELGEKSSEGSSGLHGWGYYPHWNKSVATGECTTEGGQGPDWKAPIIKSIGKAVARDVWYDNIIALGVGATKILSTPDSPWKWSIGQGHRPFTDREQLKNVHWKIFEGGEPIWKWPAPKNPSPDYQRPFMEAPSRIAVSWNYDDDCMMYDYSYEEDGKTYLGTSQASPAQMERILISIDWYPGFETGFVTNCTPAAARVYSSQTPGYYSDGSKNWALQPHHNSSTPGGYETGLREPGPGVHARFATWANHAAGATISDVLESYSTVEMPFNEDVLEYDKYTTWGVHTPEDVAKETMHHISEYDLSIVNAQATDHGGGLISKKKFTKQQMWDARQAWESQGRAEVSAQELELSLGDVEERSPGMLPLNVGSPVNRGAYQVVPLMVAFEQYFRDPDFLFNRDPASLIDEFLSLNEKTSPELWEALDNGQKFHSLFKGAGVADSAETYIEKESNFNPNILLYDLPFVEVAINNVGSGDATADIVDLFNNLNSTDSDMEAVTSQLHFINEPKKLVYQNVQVPLSSNFHKLEIEDKFHLFKSKIGNLLEDVPPAVITNKGQIVEPITYDFEFSNKYSDKVLDLVNTLFPFDEKNGSAHDEVFANLARLGEAVKEEESSVWARHTDPALANNAPRDVYTINPLNFQSQIFAKLLRSKFQEYYSAYGGAEIDDPFFDKIEYALATYGYSGLKYAYSSQMFARLHNSRLHEIRHYRTLWKELLKTPEKDRSINPECAEVFDQLSIVSSKDLKNSETDLFNIENVKQSIKEYYKNSICYDVFDKNTDAENSVTRSLKQGLVMLMARVYSLEMCLASVIAWDSFDLEDVVRDNLFPRIIVRNMQNEIEDYDEMVKIAGDIIKKQNNYQHFEMWEKITKDSALNYLVRNESLDIAKKVSKMITNIFPDKDARATTRLNLEIFKNSDPNFVKRYEYMYGRPYARMNELVGPEIMGNYMSEASPYTAWGSDGVADVGSTRGSGFERWWPSYLYDEQYDDISSDAGKLKLAQDIASTRALATRTREANDLANLYNTYGAEYVVHCELTENLYTMNYGHCFQVNPHFEGASHLLRYASKPSSLDILNLKKKNKSEFGITEESVYLEDYIHIETPMFYAGSPKLQPEDIIETQNAIQGSRAAILHGSHRHQKNVLYSLPYTLMYVNNIGDLSALPSLTSALRSINYEEAGSNAPYNTGASADDGKTPPQLWEFSIATGPTSYNVLDNAGKDISEIKKAGPVGTGRFPAMIAVHMPLLYHMETQKYLAGNEKPVWGMRDLPHQTNTVGDMRYISRFSNPRKITNNYNFDTPYSFHTEYQEYPGHNVWDLPGSIYQLSPSVFKTEYYYVCDNTKGSAMINELYEEFEFQTGTIKYLDSEWEAESDPKRRLSSRMYDRLYSNRGVRPIKASPHEKENIHEFTWANGYNMLMGNMIIQTFVKVTERDPSTYDKFRLLKFADLDPGEYTPTGSPCATPGKTITEVGAAEVLTSFMAEFENYRSGENEFRSYIYDYIPLPVWCHFFKNVFMQSIHKNVSEEPNVEQYGEHPVPDDEQYQNIKYLFNRYGLEPFFEKIEFGLRFTYTNSYGLTEPEGINFREFMKDTMPIDGLKKCKTLYSNRIARGIGEAENSVTLYDEVHIPIVEVKQAIVFESDGFKLEGKDDLYDYDEIAYGGPGTLTIIQPTSESWIDQDGAVLNGSVESLIQMGEGFKHYTNTFSQFFYKKVVSNLMLRLENTAEFKLLFEHVFPLKRYMSLAFIYAGDGLTKFIPEPTAILEETKSSLKMAMSGLVNSDNYQYQPNPIDSLLEKRQIAQNRGTAGKEPDLTKQILEVLYKTPLLILKGFVEVTDPAVIIAKAIIDAANAIVQSVIAVVEQGLKAVKQGIESAIQQAKSTLSNIESNLSMATGQVKAAKIPLKSTLGENIDEVIIIQTDGEIVSDDGATLWEIRIDESAMTEDQKEALQDDDSWKNIKKLVGEAKPMIDDYASIKVKIIDLEAELEKVEVDLREAVAEAKKISQAVFSSPFMLPGLWAALIPSMLPYFGGLVPPPFFIGPPSTIPGMIYLLLMFLDAFEEKMHDVVDELDSLGCTEDI